MSGQIPAKEVNGNKNMEAPLVWVWLCFAGRWHCLFCTAQRANTGRRHTSFAPPNIYTRDLFVQLCIDLSVQSCLLCRHDRMSLTVYYLNWLVLWRVIYYSWLWYFRPSSKYHVMTRLQLGAEHKINSVQWLISVTSNFGLITVKSQQTTRS